MSKIRKLAGQTAVYGLSTIIGRLLNFLLFPFYSYVFRPEEFGVVTELYAYIAFLLIIYHYGMETAFFHFSNKIEDAKKVYNTSFISLLLSTSVFTFLLVAFTPAIANALEYHQHHEYFYMLALILALDTLAVVPFTRLRKENKALKFALVKLANIGFNIIFNLFFLWLAPAVLQKESLQFLHPAISMVYSPAIGVGYVFISNLLSSALTLPLLWKEISALRFEFDRQLWKTMLIYSSPLIIIGFTGMVNQMLDKAMLKHLLPGSIDFRMAQLGIYGACYKLAIFMTLANQAFRFAAEPFFFAQAREKDAPETFSTVMKYYVIFSCFIFLGVMLYLEIVKYMIAPAYHEGLHIVPVILLANLFLGIYYNLSIWYKITERVKTGAVISLFGAALTIGLNILWIPLFSYTGSAYATLLCFFGMTIISWRLGQKYFPVPYPVKAITFYIAFAVALYLLSFFNGIYLTVPGSILYFVVNTFLLLVFLSVVLLREKPNFPLTSR